MRMSVGVDLHKKQFTVYWRVEGGRERSEYNRYLTNEDGYQEFEQKLRAVASLADSVSVAVESTGNTRYSKNLLRFNGALPQLVVGHTLVQRRREPTPDRGGLRGGRVEQVARLERVRLEVVDRLRQRRAAQLRPALQELAKMRDPAEPSGVEIGRQIGIRP